MKISVIIPTYKPQKYLWECLDSLCNQTFSHKDFEIIIVLNGCNEPYYKDICAYTANNTEMNWRLFQISQGGVSNARNVALSKAIGEYIAFVDDDDYLSSTYLEELFNKSSKDTIALSNAFAFNDGEPDLQLKYVISDAFNEYSSVGKQKSKKVRKFFSSPCFKLIHREIVNDRKYDVRFKNGEDSLFMFLISDRVKYVDFTSPDAIYYRRYRYNSAITIKKSKKYIIENSLKLILAYTCIYLERPFRYSFRRYMQAILGSFHLIIVNIC